MHVEHFMTKNPVACDANEPVESVARLMRDKGVGCVVVLRNGRVAGIVTDRQLTIGVLGEGLGAETPVSDVMTTDPACCTLDDNLFSVLDTMRSAGVVRRVPVVNANKELLGIVSISDVAPIAKDLIDAVLLEDLHHSTQEAHILTGAKRIVKEIRRPTKDMPPEQETRPMTEATPRGVVASGGAGDPPGSQRGQGSTPSTREASGEARGGQRGGSS